MDRNDRSQLPGYDELIARGNYHRMMGGPDHLDSEPALPRRETVGTVFGFMEPAQSDDVSVEEPEIFPVSCRSTAPTAQRHQETSTVPTVQQYKEIPTIQRHRQVPTVERHQGVPTVPTLDRNQVMPPSKYSPPLVHRRQPVGSRPNAEVVEADCAPRPRQRTEGTSNQAIPSFGPPGARLCVDPTKVHLLEEVWNQGSVDSGLGSVSVTFPSRDDTHFVPSISSLTDDVRHISIKSMDEGPLGPGRTSISPPEEEILPVSTQQTQTTQVHPQEPNGNVILDATQRFQRNLWYFEQDSDQETRLHYLIYADRDDIVLTFLDDLMSYHMLDITNKRRQTLLHVAALMDKPRLCRAILAHGASVDVRDVRGNTPLHLACQKGHVACVEVLSRHLNYQEVKDVGYQVPFRCIPQSSELRNYDGQTCLHLAAAGGHYDIVHYLVHDLHADINAREGKRGLTALMQSVERRDARMLMYLVQQCRANIHTRTYDRRNALELAEGRGYTDIANLLRAIGAEVDCSDEEDSDWLEEDMDETTPAEPALIGQ